MKRGKASGPDKATADMYKLLDTENIGPLEKLINGMLESEGLPECRCNAYIASVFKKESVATQQTIDRFRV